jgi:hypothetical protein
MPGRLKPELTHQVHPILRLIKLSKEDADKGGSVRRGGSHMVT